MNKKLTVKDYLREAEDDADAEDLKVGDDKEGVTNTAKDMAKGAATASLDAAATEGQATDKGSATSGAFLKKLAEIGGKVLGGLTSTFLKMGSFISYIRKKYSSKNPELTYVHFYLTNAFHAWRRGKDDKLPTSETESPNETTEQKSAEGGRKSKQFRIDAMKDYNQMLQKKDWPGAVLRIRKMTERINAELKTADNPEREKYLRDILAKVAKLGVNDPKKFAEQPADAQNKIASKDLKQIYFDYLNNSMFPGLQSNPVFINIPTTASAAMFTDSVMRFGEALNEAGVIDAVAGAAGKVGGAIGAAVDAVKGGAAKAGVKIANSINSIKETPALMGPKPLPKETNMVKRWELVYQQVKKFATIADKKDKNYFFLYRIAKGYPLFNSTMLNDGSMAFLKALVSNSYQEGLYNFLKDIHGIKRQVKVGIGGVGLKNYPIDTQDPKAFSIGYMNDYNFRGLGFYLFFSIKDLNNADNGGKMILNSLFEMHETDHISHDDFVNKVLKKQYQMSDADIDAITKKTEKDGKTILTLKEDAPGAIVKALVGKVWARCIGKFGKKAYDNLSKIAKDQVCQNWLSKFSKTRLSLHQMENDLPMGEEEMNKWGNKDEIIKKLPDELLSIFTPLRMVTLAPTTPGGSSSIGFTLDPKRKDSEPILASKEKLKAAISLALGNEEPIGDIEISTDNGFSSALVSDTTMTTKDMDSLISSVASQTRAINDKNISSILATVRKRISGWYNVINGW